MTHFCCGSGTQPRASPLIGVIPVSSQCHPQCHPRWEKREGSSTTKPRQSCPFLSSLCRSLSVAHLDSALTPKTPAVHSTELLPFSLSIPEKKAMALARSRLTAALPTARRVCQVGLLGLLPFATSASSNSFSNFIFVC